MKYRIRTINGMRKIADGNSVLSSIGNWLKQDSTKDMLKRLAVGGGTFAGLYGLSGLADPKGKYRWQRAAGSALPALLAGYYGKDIWNGAGKGLGKLFGKKDVNANPYEEQGLNAAGEPKNMGEFAEWLLVNKSKDIPDVKDKKELFKYYNEFLNTKPEWQKLRRAGESFMSGPVAAFRDSGFGSILGLKDPAREKYRREVEESEQGNPGPSPYNEEPEEQPFQPVWDPTGMHIKQSIKNIQDTIKEIERDGQGKELLPGARARLKVLQDRLRRGDTSID